VDQTQAQPVPDPAPDTGTAPSSPAASAPVRSGFTLRGRRWVYGATLAAAGVLAGSGITYAVVSTTTADPTVQSSTQGGPGGSGAPGPAGGPPPGAAPDGTLPSAAAPDTGGAAT
jgi:hypothetical protein